jgi:hypothetical protein
MAATAGPPSFTTAAAGLGSGMCAHEQPREISDCQPWHGTLNGYRNHRCRCERCREAKRIKSIKPATLPKIQSAALGCGHEFLARCLPYRGDLVWCWSCGDWQEVSSGKQEQCFDAEPVVLTTRRRLGGGKRSHVHLVMQRAVALPPRKIAYQGGRWFRRSAGDFVCNPWTSVRAAHNTITEPTDDEVTCPACIAIAGQRRISYQRVPKRRRAAPGNGHSGDASTAAA